MIGNFLEINKMGELVLPRSLLTVPHMTILVAVMIRLVRAFHRYANVVRLFLGKLG